MRTVSRSESCEPGGGPKIAISLFPTNLLSKTGLTQIFPGDFWPENVKNVKAAAFRDSGVKIVDASLRFWRRFSGFSIFEFLVNKIVIFLAGASFKFRFCESICSKMRFRNFRPKIDDASPRFRCCFPKLTCFAFFLNKMCFLGMRNFKNCDF